MQKFIYKVDLVPTKYYSFPWQEKIRSKLFVSLRMVFPERVTKGDNFKTLEWALGYLVVVLKKSHIATVKNNEGRQSKQKQQ